MNLQVTTDLVLLHRMPPDVEKQVVGRCQRPVRVEALRIWELRHHSE
jgi:hypothetical protein